MSWRDGIDFSSLPASILAELRCHVSDIDFECAICHRYINCRWNPKGSRREIHPICHDCETVKWRDWNGKPRYRSKASGGTHMDRRNAMRIDALADALGDEATRMKWSDHNGIA